MIKTAKGFSALKGVGITRIKTDGVNQVTLFDADGDHFYVIEGEVGQLGIAHLTCTKHKVEKYKRPITRSQNTILKDQSLD